MANEADLTIVLSGKDQVSGVLKAIAANVGFAALKEGVKGVTSELTSMAREADEDAASTARLRQAVENTGTSWNDYKGQLEDIIDRGERLAFTDDQTREALSLMTQQTGDAAEAQRRLVLAQDLSRGANIDLVTASRLLGKVTEDNVNVLARYGISVKEGATETELFGMIQERFGGQAERFSRENAAGAERMRIQYGELREELGAKVAPALNATVEGLMDLPMPLQLATVGLVEFGPAVGQTVLGLTAMIPALSSAIKMLPALASAALAAGPLVAGLAIAVGAAYAAGELLGGGLPEWAKEVEGLQEPTLQLARLEEELANASGLEADVIRRQIEQIQKAVEEKKKLAEETARLSEKTKEHTNEVNQNILALANQANQLGVAELAARHYGNALFEAAGGVAQMPADFGGLGVPGNAMGTRNWRGGWTVVGEEGPELVNLPRGSDIYSHQESMGNPPAASSGSGGLTIVVQNAYGFDDFDQKIRGIITKYHNNGGGRGVVGAVG